MTKPFNLATTSWGMASKVLVALAVDAARVG